MPALCPKDPRGQARQQRECSTIRKIKQTYFSLDPIAMLEDPIVRHIAVAVVVVIGSAGIGYILKHLLHRAFRGLVERRVSTLDERILDVILARIIPLSIIVGGYAGTREIRSGLSPQHVTHHQVLDYVEIVLFVALVIILTRFVSRTIRTTFEWYMEEVSAKTHSDIAPTVAPLLSKIINIVLFLISGMVILDHFGINIGSLLVSLGVGSLAVALAAQETVANMIAGFVILIDQPFRVGDRIRLPSGEEGDITQIGLRSTRILNADANLVIIPNGELVKNRIVNYSFPSGSVRVSVDVVVRPGTDLQKVKKVLMDAAAEHPEIGKGGSAAVAVVAFNEWNVRLQVGATISDYRRKFAVETELREKIYERFRREGIEMTAIPLVARIAGAHEA